MARAAVKRCDRACRKSTIATKVGKWRRCRPQIQAEPSPRNALAAAAAKFRRRASVATIGPKRSTAAVVATYVRTANSGLVANPTSAGTPASAHRCRSSVHDSGRYKDLSM